METFPSVHPKTVALEQNGGTMKVQLMLTNHTYRFGGVSIWVA